MVTAAGTRQKTDAEVVGAATCGSRSAFRPRRSALAERGMLITEAVVAMGILAAVLIPLSFIFYQETRLCRAYYYDAVALEVVDGEMEVLAAGEWRACNEGTHRYQPAAMAATNLPAGEFVLTHDGPRVQLEWRPAQRGRGRPIVREWTHP